MTEAQAQLVGKTEIRPLSDVKPNIWNPNRMTEQMKASLKHGFIHDGWLVSQQLLIWGTDDEGVEKNIIIDGEHRWTTGNELGMLEGPMVFLTGLSETKAKALTIKMNQKRGEFVDDLLANVLRDIESELGSDDMGIDLGFDDETIMSLMAEDPEDVDGNKGSEKKAEAAKGFKAETGSADMRSAGTHVRLIQLFFDTEQHATFTEAVKKLATEYGTTNVTETVLKAVLELTEEENTD